MLTFRRATTFQDVAHMANEQHLPSTVNQHQFEGNTGPCTVNQQQPVIDLTQMLEKTLALYSKPLEKPAGVAASTTTAGRSFDGPDLFEDDAAPEEEYHERPDVGYMQHRFDMSNQYVPSEQQPASVCSAEWLTMLPPPASLLSGGSSQVESSPVPSFVPFPSFGATVVGGGEMPAKHRGHLPKRTSPTAPCASLATPFFNPRQFTHFDLQSLAEAGPGESGSESGFCPSLSAAGGLAGEGSEASAAAPAAKAKQPLTTLMIRNVPINYTQDMLLRHWPNRGTYDFLYLPGSTEGEQNLSYAFINFSSEAHAEAFKEAWQKKRLPRFSARKALSISYADVQGLHANLMHLKKKHARRLKVHQCEPAIFKEGRRVSVEEALQMLMEDRSKVQSNNARIEAGAAIGMRPAAFPPPASFAVGGACVCAVPRSFA